jgi:leader peptidase (prepilin peptidase)/N-methyltransferase
MPDIQLDEILLIPWMFVLGAIIGSFLNVVVYRAPKGMSLISPPSHCPNCEHHIRWYDNIPIVSWFVLGRKCRDCKAAIAGRYPLVEAATAGMFALLTAVEFTLKGANLPLNEIYHGDYVISFSRNNSELYGILLYHLLLLCTLLAAGLIEFDGHNAPRRLFMPVLAAGIIAPLVWPYLHPMPAWPALAEGARRILDCAAGLAAGGLLGYIAWHMPPVILSAAKDRHKSKNSKTPGGIVWGLVCTGVFLGWQAVCIIALIIALFALFAAVLKKRRKSARPWPVSICLYAVTLGFILAWSQIVDLIK